MVLAQRHVLSSDDAGTGEERSMNEVTTASAPGSELERLIAELSESGLLVFVFGDGFSAARPQW